MENVNTYDMRRLKKLALQSRFRGTKEMTLLFGKFAEERLARLTPEQLDEFERILNMGDIEAFDALSKGEKDGIWGDISGCLGGKVT